jgi:signal transduction histidine kinase
MRRLALLFCVASALLASNIRQARALDPEAELKDPNEVTLLVHAAAKLLERTGTNAFAEFNTPDSRWFHGSTSVFVYDPNGRVVSDPGQPGNVGRDEMGMKDADGRPITASIIAAATGARSSGWSHYLAVPAGDAQPQWRSAYSVGIKMPDGEEVIVGAAFFTPLPSRYFIKESVDRAADELAARGEDVLSAINNKLGLYSYGSTSVYVFDSEGSLLADATSPKADLGSNLLAVRNLDGQSPAELILQSFEKGGNRTWVDYRAPLADGQIGNRQAYSRKVQIGDTTLYVAAGLFVNLR